jgi:hypothetical protein
MPQNYNNGLHIRGLQYFFESRSSCPCEAREGKGREGSINLKIVFTTKIFVNILFNLGLHRILFEIHARWEREQRL